MLNYKVKSTKLIKPFKYLNVLKRTMQATRNVISKTLIQKTNPNLNISNSNSYLKRSYASAHAGRFKLPNKTSSNNLLKTNQPTASNDAIPLIKSDIKGGHSIGVLAVCAKRECKNTNCAEGTAETNPCKASGEYHQQEINDASNSELFGIVHEVNGALTHKLPEGFEGEEIALTDMKGKNVSQYVVKERGVIPLDKAQFKEDSDKTLYLQKTEITAHLINNASPDSVMNLVNKAPTTLLSKVNTPVDNDV